MSKPTSSTPGTKIIACNCSHEQQDKMYGKGMRVHNRVDGKGKPVGYACTVCTPRNLPCERNGTVIQAQPAFGLRNAIPARKLRTLKPM